MFARRDVVFFLELSDVHVRRTASFDRSCCQLLLTECLSSSEAITDHLLLVCCCGYLLCAAFGFTVAVRRTLELMVLQLFMQVCAVVWIEARPSEARAVRLLPQGSMYPYSLYLDPKVPI